VLAAIFLEQANVDPYRESPFPQSEATSEQEENSSMDEVEDEKGIIPDSGEPKPMQARTPVETAKDLIERE